MNEISIIEDKKYNFIFKEEFKLILDIYAKVLNFKNNLKVDVLITDNKKIKKISKQYRNINKETDVLSFPFEFALLSDQLGFCFLGEIVLSFEKIEEQAKKYGHSLKREFCYLFAHGLVHLSGKDHKIKEEEQEFNDIVEKIMKKMKISRNN